MSLDTCTVFCVQRPVSLISILHCLFLYLNLLSRERSLWNVLRWRFQGTQGRA